MKKLLLFIAFAIFGFGLNAQNVGDETTIDYDDYSLKFKVTSVEPAECEVSGRTGSPTEVTIPSTVTISGTEFNVTSIGERAFYYCKSLTGIEIPNSVTFIGEDAFYDCSSLTSIEIPNSVTSIGENAFRYCSSLTSIVIPNSVTSIGNWAFSDCSSLTNIEIPNSVTSIGRGAFLNCVSLKSIEIPNSVTSIGHEAFYDCSSLTSIEIPNSVTSIGSVAFSDCSSLTSIVVAEGNTVYDSRENCNAIIETSSNKLIAGCQNTVIPNTVTSIGGSAFYYCSSLTSIVIPNSVTSIGNEAFSGCSSLTSIVIPNSVTYIGSSAFSHCSSLTNIEIPNSVTSIGEYAFYGCSSLTSITFGDNPQPTSIGNYAFSSCSSLTNIEIPNSVTSIGSSAFSGCSSLTSIVVAEGNTVYDSRENCNAIIETSSNTLTVGCQNTVIPNSVTEIGHGAFSRCSSLTSIDIPSSVTSIGGAAFHYCSNLTSIEIPNSVTSIGQQAFDGCSSLTSIEIPNSVTSIGQHAFLDCSSLTSIVIPNSVTYIGSSAFSSCSSLTSITFGDNPQLTSIGDGAFYECSSLTSIEIPNSVTSIGSSAFWNCSSLTSIEIPNSVTSIGRSAFSECSSLKVIKCYAENVPETGSAVFYKCPSDMIIYVPEVSLEDYKSASPWNAFTILSLNEGPRNIIATTDSAFSVNLSWDNCYADSYNVYRNGDSIANVTNPTYTDIDLEYNTEYCYTVTAVRNETETDKSEEVCAKTLDLPITTPENLVADVLSTSSIILTWDNVENALSYNVYRNGDSIANVTNPTYTDVDLECNTEYCYTVTAVRNETESDKSEEKCAKTFDLPITTTENLVAEALSTSSISLSWDAVENALSYNVYQANKVIANVEETTFTVDGLEYNTEYCYTVTAVRNETESDKSEEVCAKTLGESINELSSSINIYPNPVENDLFIATEMNVKEVAIYDVYGRLCCRDASNASTSNSMDTFNVSVQDLEAGVYFVKVVTNEGEIVKRFVKK